MKHTVILLTLVLLNLIQAHGQIRYNRVYNTGDTLPPFPSSFCFDLLPDANQFIVAGDNYSPTRTAYLAGFNYSGTQLWQKDLHFAGNFNISPGPSTMVRLSASTYAMLGSELDLTINPNIVVEQPYLYFFDNHGDSLRYAKFVDSFESRRMLSLTRTSDNYLVATGIKYLKSIHYSSGIWINDSTSCYVSKFDTLGNLIWTKQFLQHQNLDIGQSKSLKVIEGENGTIIIAGTSEISSLSGNEKYSHFVTMLDSNGNTLWLRNYRYNSYDEWEGLRGIDITPASNGGFYFLTGRSVVPKIDPRSPPESNVFYYGRCNMQGDTLWTKTFARPLSTGGYEWTEGSAIRRDEDGNLLLMGAVYYYWYRPTLVIADSNGRVKSYRRYQYRAYSGATSVSQTIYDICRTPNKQLLMGGNVSNNSLSDWDSLGSYTWLIQTDSLGCLEPDCADADSIFNQPLSMPGHIATVPISIYPNPTDGVLHIVGLTKGKPITTEITDLQGRTIIREKLEVGQEVIKVQMLATGTYVLVIYDDNDRHAFKFLKR